MNPRIKNVVPQKHYKLLLYFTNGEQGIYDCTNLLNHGVFEELQDETYFNKVLVLDGTIAWPDEQDICPDTLYLDSILFPKYKQ